jgi:hypothetical protein
MAIKTTTVTFRLAPAIKELLRLAAVKEHRSVANMIEVMVLTYTKNMKKKVYAGAGHNDKKDPVSGKPRKTS